jgi:uncharacterized protein (UPF0218 family)
LPLARGAVVFESVPSLLGKDLSLVVPSDLPVVVETELEEVADEVNANPVVSIGDWEVSNMEEVGLPFVSEVEDEKEKRGLESSPKIQKIEFSCFQLVNHQSISQSINQHFLFSL